MGGIIFHIFFLIEIVTSVRKDVGRDLVMFLGDLGHYLVLEVIFYFYPVNWYMIWPRAFFSSKIRLGKWQIVIVKIWKQDGWVQDLF